MKEPTKQEIELISLAYSKDELARHHCLLVNDVTRLETELKAMRGAANSYKIHYEKARSEAIKEFAERLRSHYPHTQSILKRIECIEKEMTEEKNDEQRRL